MSFAGHVFDMIRRNKEDRERLKQLRDRVNDGIEYSSRIPDISAEEFERIQQQTQEREQLELRYFSHATWVILIVIVVLLLAMSWIFDMLVS